MIDAQGDPNPSQEFQHAVQALYSLSYRLKLLSTRALGTDDGVLPLEGLWWAENVDDFVKLDKDDWLSTLMIRQPAHISKKALQDPLQAAKTKTDPPHSAKGPL